ncbi:ankyrin repeat and SAM domain-containing protein 4B [Saccopteryx bilineata]|uniref:ankyrin repeat and SAM domain-containing protein 4B n=1 Tax=Saccopteryx bilineata TaxID=59482 RepID=UPI00338D8989
MSTRYHQAASDSYLELLKEATRRDLNLSDDDGMTPTLLAAYHGNLEALEVICSRGGDPDRCDIWGNTPLHYAASNGHAHCVSFLINFGANIFALDNDFQTPLEAAAGRERHQCVLLLDRAATAQNIASPRKVARLKEQAQKNAQRQIREWERLQERHQQRTARARGQEASGSLSSSKGVPPGSSSLSSASASRAFGSLSKGILGTFRTKFKKNKDTAEQVGKEYRTGQRNVMEVFPEEEEQEKEQEEEEKDHAFSGDSEERRRVSAEDSRAPHESILSRPGLGSIVFRRGRILSPEDISDSKKELAFKVSRELLQSPGAPQEDGGAAEEEGEEEDLPWGQDAVEWEEDTVGATPLEVFLQSHQLEKLLPFFTREQMDLDALLLCSDEDLQSIQMQLGPRKKVLHAINRRKHTLQQPGPLVDTSL